MHWMKQAAIVVAVALAFISSSKAAVIQPTECPANQEWNDCGTACPNKCGEPVAFFCTMQCVIGCQCPSGWWLDGDFCVEDETQCISNNIPVEPPVELEPWNPPLLGGWTDWDEATEEVQNIANEMQEAVESEMGDSFEHFTANTYQSQVVNGWNYRIQIDVGRPHMLEILVYKHWSGTTELNESRYQTPHCPYNQEWNDCGTACPNKCGEEEALFCTYNCVPECQCPHGWWLQDNDICVEKSSECSFPEPGPDACASEPCLNGGLCELPQDDPGHGEFYCWCKEGFEGEFCEIELNIHECPHNQEFNECGTACPNECGKPEPFICTMQCEIGCQCPFGWWKKEDGSCVESASACDA